MNEKIPEYEKWKSEMENELVDLVARNFDRLYDADGSEYSRIWAEISEQLYEKYDLMNVDKEDPEYELKCKKEHCIYINMRIYVEKEFPYELFDPMVSRFVKQYGKLPKQAPDEWNNFEVEEKVKVGEERKASNNRITLALEQYAATLSEDENI